MRDDAILVRATAARRLIADGEVDPYEALELVVWPTERLDRDPPNDYPPETRQEAVRLAADGISRRVIARQLLGNEKRHPLITEWVAAARTT